MDLKRLDFSLKTVFFLLVVFSINASGQTLCSAPNYREFEENNSIGDTVAEISILEGVSLTITQNPLEAFGLNGNLLVANKVLDFEELTPDGRSLTVSIRCSNEITSIVINIIVVVININDNPPVFAQSQYDLEVDELSAVGTRVGKIEATDLDGDQLYYQLVDSGNEFRLLDQLNPEIVVNKILDYDTTPEVNMVLFVQDTPLTTSVSPSHNASTSIKVTIIDINNRPPWFQPCTETYIGTTTICLSSGYQGTVNQTEQATDPLILEPGPLHAIDGDKGRNEPISYSIIAGNNDDIFNINTNTGDITMEKSVEAAAPIVLTVMAYETLTPDQFATTTVTLRVVERSKHPPEFVKSSYMGFISEDTDVGSLVLESGTSNKPLQVQATDADFTDGVNPNIRFDVNGSPDFRITQEGFVLMMNAVSPGKVELEIYAVDTTNDESGKATLTVEVTPGVHTTTMEMPTTTIPLTPSTNMITSPSITTDMVTSTAVTTDMATGTSITTDMVTSSAITTDVAVSIAVTTDMVTGTSITTEQTESTSNPATITTDQSPETEGLPGPVGGFKVEEMAALGASLAVVLLLCLVVIGLLVCRIKQHDADWRKLSEASIFRSTLTGGSTGPKDGVQYTNEGFQNDEDTGSVSSKQAAELPLPVVQGLSRNVPDQLEKQRSAPTLQDRISTDSGSPPADASSLSASDNTDSEKEVKPILTKERRVEDGYKAVWFKQDIDPSVKEEVVIISDNGERDVVHDDDDDDDDDDEEEEEEEGDVRNTSMSARRRNLDSDDEEGLTSDL